jgi:2-polyprenyl-3-methyl-5-hydroxy-6-metoxy-1,4-benzoquinol methylase
MDTDKNTRPQQRAQEQFESLIINCGAGGLDGKKMLEIGFKDGLLLNRLHKAGAIATGLEINGKLYDSVKNKFPDLDVILYDGQNFPIPDESFDYVISFQVLEHVQSIEDIFAECTRILRPGGIMHHICPNYFSFYEGHYKVIWFPFFNKFLGRAYLKLLRRHTQYYESLNLVKPGNVIASLKKHKNLSIISIGKSEFINKFKNSQIEKVKLKPLRKILTIISKTGPVKKMILSVINTLNLYYPLTITVRKNNPVHSKQSNV